jgi:transcriptional regulator with XRE-family HTH domain
MPADEGETEASVIGAGHVGHATGEHLAAVAADLLATERDEVRRRDTLVTEIAVHVRGGRVPGIAGVDDDDGSSLAAELQRRGKAGGRTADDGDVAVALDDAGAWSGMSTTIRSHPHGANPLALFARRLGRCRDRPFGPGTTRAHALAQPAHVAGSVPRRVGRAHALSASTISRIETGKRTISLDVLVPLARGLHVDIDALLEDRSDDDVIIRPIANRAGGHTTWMLSRPTGSTVAIKMRLEPTTRTPELKVHPGHDWFFVIEGRVQLFARRTHAHRRDR